VAGARRGGLRPVREVGGGDLEAQAGWGFGVQGAHLGADHEQFPAGFVLVAASASTASVTYIVPSAAPAASQLGVTTTTQMTATATASPIRLTGLFTEPRSEPPDAASELGGEPRGERRCHHDRALCRMSL
jgi:hypothetical protein